MQKILLLLTMCSIAFAGNIIINGTYEQDLNVGWLQNVYGGTITRATNYDPDPDYEVQAYKSAGSGYAKLYQTVIFDFPVSDLSFAIDAKLWAYDNNADTLCWAAAAVIVSYMNSSGTRLGDTRICMKTTPCPWVSTSTRHIISVFDSLWHQYSFNIATELGNLPGIDPGSVRRIEIALYDTTAHTC